MTKLTQIRQAARADNKRRRIIVWSVFALVLFLLPTVLFGLQGITEGAGFKISALYALTVLTQILIAAVFALAYNMLLGQGGMLSFGHAVYYGLGGYFAMHVMNAVAGGLPIPMVFMPIFGGIFGMMFGVIIGSFSTRKSGTVFAMISLGIGELMAASSLIIIAFFGGEEGVSANRTKGPEILGFNLSQQDQVYYFAAFWFFVATFMMYRFSRTPAGRMANAVRDNPERVEFVGYNTRYVRYVSFIASAFFAGIAGGMFAIQYEIVTESVLNAGASGVVLLQTYVGGALYFIGPIVGSFVVTILNTVVAGATELSLLYSGLIFVAVVLFIPQGVTGLIVMHGPAMKSGRIVHLIIPYILLAIPLVATFIGLVGIIETLHFIENTGVGDTTKKLFYTEFNAASWQPWAVFSGLTVIGVTGCYFCGKLVKSAWERIEEATKNAQKKSEASSGLMSEKAAV